MNLTTTRRTRRRQCVPVGGWLGGGVRRRGEHARGQQSGLGGGRELQGDTWSSRSGMATLGAESAAARSPEEENRGGSWRRSVARGGRPTRGGKWVQEEPGRLGGVPVAAQSRTTAREPAATQNHGGGGGTLFSSREGEEED